MENVNTISLDLYIDRSIGGIPPGALSFRSDGVGGVRTATQNYEPFSERFFSRKKGKREKKEKEKRKKKERKKERKKEKKKTGPFSEKTKKRV